MAPIRQVEVEDALMDAVAHLAAAASAYRTYARRAPHLRPRAEADAFFTTRVRDFERAAKRAQAACREVAAARDKAGD